MPQPPQPAPPATAARAQETRLGPKPKSAAKKAESRTEGIPNKAENKSSQSQEAAAGFIWLKPPQGWGSTSGTAHDISPDFKTLSTPQTNNTTQGQTRTSTSSPQEMGVRRSLFHDATGEWHAHSRKKGPAIVKATPQKGGAKPYK